MKVRIKGALRLEHDVDGSMSVLDFKALIADSHPDHLLPEHIKLIYRGRVLKDPQTLHDAGVVHDSDMHLVKAKTTSQNQNASSTDLANHQNNNSYQSTQPNDSSMGLMQQMLSSPMMQGILDQPEMLRSMLMANPQIKQMVDANPELGHILNDTSLLRQSLESTRNPELRREMQRNTDRAMSNIEMHPEGYNMLRRMYSTIQEPFDNIAPSEFLDSSTTEEGHQSSSTASSTTNGQTPNTSALPNPWAPTPQQPPGGPTFSNGPLPPTLGNGPVPPSAFGNILFPPTLNASSPPSQGIPIPIRRTSPAAAPNAKPISVRQSVSPNSTAASDPLPATSASQVSTQQQVDRAHALLQNPDALANELASNPRAQALLSTNPLAAQMLTQTDFLQRLSSTMRQVNGVAGFENSPAGVENGAASTPMKHVGPRPADSADSTRACKGGCGFFKSPGSDYCSKCKP